RAPRRLRILPGGPARLAPRPGPHGPGHAPRRRLAVPAPGALPRAGREVGAAAGGEVPPARARRSDARCGGRPPPVARAAIGGLGRGGLPTRGLAVAVTRGGSLLTAALRQPSALGWHMPTPGHTWL